MNIANDPSVRRTPHATYRGYLYLAWKLQNPGDRDLRKDAERLREAIGAVCRERKVDIEHLAVWRTSVHLLCTLPHRDAPAALLEVLRERTAQILRPDERLWAGDGLLNTVSHEAREETIRIMQEPAG